MYENICVFCLLLRICFVFLCTFVPTFVFSRSFWGKTAYGAHRSWTAAERWRGYGAGIIDAEIYCFEEVILWNIRDTWVSYLLICVFKIICFYISSYFRYRFYRPAHVSWATLNGKACAVVISEKRFCGGLVWVNQWLLSATDRFWAVLLVHAVVGIFNVLRVGWCIGIMISNEREQTWDLQQSQTINQYQFHCFPMWRKRSNHRRLNGSPGKAKSSKDGRNPGADAEYRDMDMASK